MKISKKLQITTFWYMPFKFYLCIKIITFYILFSGNFSGNNAHQHHLSTLFTIPLQLTFLF